METASIQRLIEGTIRLSLPGGNQWKLGVHGWPVRIPTCTATGWEPMEARTTSTQNGTGTLVSLSGGNQWKFAVRQDLDVSSFVSLPGGNQWKYGMTRSRGGLDDQLCIAIRWEPMEACRTSIHRVRRSPLYRYRVGTNGSIGP